MRLYSVAVASLAIDAPLKWTDNLIAHHDIPDVRSRTRGVARGVSWAGLVRIALVRELQSQLGCGVREAVALSDALLQSPSGSQQVGRWSTLAFDRRALEQDLQRRLAEALESAPRRVGAAGPAPRARRSKARVAQRPTC